MRLSAAILSVLTAQFAMAQGLYNERTIPVTTREVSAVIREREALLAAARQKLGPHRTQELIIEALQRQTEYQKELSLSDVFFIGTHNSYNSTSYGVFSGLAEQKLTLTEQLDLGIRFLMLDVKNCGGDLYAVHKFCLDKLTNAGRFRNFLEEIRRWKDEHPTETILVDIENNNDQSFDAQLTEMVNETMGHYLYPPQSLYSFPELKQVKGRVLFFLERFRDSEEHNKIFYGTFFRYAASPGELEGAGKAAAEFTFFPRYPENLVSKFRGIPSSVSEFDGVKEQGFLVMYEGTNLAIRSAFQITPEDLAQMMYSGVNVVSLDSIDTTIRATTKLFAGLWSFDPFREPLNTGCVYLNESSLLWEEAPCAEEHPVACWVPRNHEWISTADAHRGDDARQACRKAGGEFRSPSAPGDIWIIQAIDPSRKIWINARLPS